VLPEFCRIVAANIESCKVLSAQLDRSQPLARRAVGRWALARGPNLQWRRLKAARYHLALHSTLIRRPKAHGQWPTAGFNGDAAKGAQRVYR
jgi:hypothetical protein